LKILPTLTREGVSDSIGLAWLHAIGGIDRVLANVLAKTDFLLIDQPGSNTRDAILHLARDWKGKAQSIPKSLSEIHSKALVGALADEYTE
jgi:hypothetical protein